MPRFALLPMRRAKIRVGLLGGSFNPPHKGHFYIAKEALKRLGLHKLVWLVSPQNPLKTKSGTATLAHRCGLVQALARHPKMIISDFEKDQKHTYTAHTIARLKRLHPNVEFIWVMGADNLMQFHKWHYWRFIAETVPICVFDRVIGTAVNIYKALASRALRYYPVQQVSVTHLRYQCRPKSMAIMRIRKIALSSSAIRRYNGHQ